MTCCKVMILIFSFLLNNTFKWKNNFPILVSSFRGLIFTSTSVTARNSTFSKLLCPSSPFILLATSLGFECISLLRLSSVIKAFTSSYKDTSRYQVLVWVFFPQLFSLPSPLPSPPSLHPQCFSHYNLWSE